MTLAEYLDEKRVTSEYHSALQSKLRTGEYRAVLPDEPIEAGDLYSSYATREWQEVVKVGITAFQTETMPRVRKLKNEPIRSASEANPEWGAW